MVTWRPASPPTQPPPSHPQPTPTAVQLRMYRLYFYFSFLTYNLGTPLLVVATSRNLLLTFLVANFEACAFYFIALQEGFSSSSWWGSGWFVDNNSTAERYVYSLYWAVTTIATVG